MRESGYSNYRGEIKRNRMNPVSWALLVVGIYFFAAILVGCAPRSPGTIEAKVLNTYIYNDPKGTTRIDFFNEKYGTVSVYDSPYFNILRLQQKAILACDYITDKGISDCSVMVLK